nr:Antitoxin protein CcdA [Klebsiella pneumoniae]QGF02586.1 CcdA protein (antitoxin to CcdB) [Klebsiella pneumoniae]QHW08896.1 type II toxin-antitoxin system antitoxin CcdA [Klebsiella pneumoniae]
MFQAGVSQLHPYAILICISSVCIPECIMKQRITVTIDSDSYQLLKSADVNISALVNRAMQNEARRLRAERWQAENQEGMAEVARFIEMNGSFADENRDW